MFVCVDVNKCVIKESRFKLVEGDEKLKVLRICRERRGEWEETTAK